MISATSVPMTSAYQEFQDEKKGGRSSALPFISRTADLRTIDRRPERQRAIRGTTNNRCKCKFLCRIACTKFRRLLMIRSDHCKRSQFHNGNPTDRENLNRVPGSNSGNPPA